MYQSAGDVEDQEPAQPRKQQNSKQDDEHENLLIYSNSRSLTQELQILPRSNKTRRITTTRPRPPLG
jgi:hypothetical protein